MDVITLAVMLEGVLMAVFIIAVGELNRRGAKGKQSELRKFEYIGLRIFAVRLCVFFLLFSILLYLRMWNL